MLHLACEICRQFRRLFTLLASESDFYSLPHLSIPTKVKRLSANHLLVISPRRRYFRVSRKYGNYGIFPALDKRRYQGFDLCGKSFVRCTDRIGYGKKPSQLSAKSTSSFRRVAFANAESVSARRFVLGQRNRKSASASGE